MARNSNERYVTRPFATGIFQFLVITAHADDRELVESLFRDVPRPPSDESESSVYSLLREDDAARSWTVSGPRLDELQFPTLEGALNLLMSAINLSSLDLEPEFLHLHAAAATKDGRAVVLAAERNTGKTTTVAQLATRGWAFVTDETVRVSTETADITGIPKPLSIKPGGSDHVEHLEPWFVTPFGDGPDDFRFVPISASGAAVDRGGRSHLVVLLRRDPDGNPAVVPETRRLHPADAVVALMQETLDAERFGAAAEALATLAAASHCYELTIGTPSDTVEQIARLFELAPAEPVAVTVLPPSDTFSSGVVSVTVGDRAVVHDTASGQIFALDAGAARVWRQLGGWKVDEQVDVNGPVIASFVAQLRALGVLAGTA